MSVCTPWVTADDIADCCPSFDGGTDTSALEAFAPFVSDVLFKLTGSVYAGECGPITVRPQGNGECSCFTSIVSGWSWDRLSNRWAYGSRSCGCRPVSEVLLAGWPREITEVRIDGVPLTPPEYRLDGFKLVRMRDPAEPDVRLLWPGCQIHDLDDTEEGTFAVDYTYGLDPPDGAAAAAGALACQLWAACNPDGAGEGECELPSNVRQVARAGLTIEFGQLVGETLRAAATGIAAIDLFLAAYGTEMGDDGSQPSVWSPDIDPYPRRVGQLGT